MNTEVAVFVSPHGNAFMRDIALWVAEACMQLGRAVTFHDDGTAPTDPTLVNLVVAPHEFYVLGDLDDAGIERATSISIPVATEQPGTPWFDLTHLLVKNSPTVLDINAHGVAALQALGVDAHHLRLGGVPTMDRTGDVAFPDRTNDVLFLGALNDRRAAQLARLAPHLWDRTADFRLFSFSRPVSGDVDGLVFGEDKYRLLADSRILVNIHRDDKLPGYFEWARMVEAMANGVCVVTDPVAAYAPLVDGEHFIATDDIESTVVELLDDPKRAETIGAAAQHAVLDSFPLHSSLADLDLNPVGAEPAVSRRVPKHRRHLHLAKREPLMGAWSPHHDIRDELHDALAAETRLQRDIDRMRCAVIHGSDDHIEFVESDAYAGAEPEVSVVVTVYNYADLVTETLDSIVASQETAFEIVVVDDHATDRSRDVVKGFIARHPDVPVLLVGSDVNRGLPAARNLGFKYSRAPYVMVMDADNLVYPTALQRLKSALDDDTEAAFAYSIMEEFGSSSGLVSAMSWYVPRLTETNYIDAQAMFRKSMWQSVGGYSTGAETTFGWEDWELWLRLAERGYRGIHVRQILGRYRVQDQSMLSTTNLVAGSIHRSLVHSFPNLPWPEGVRA